MSPPAGHDRRTEQAATTALLVVMLVFAAAATAGLDRATARSGAHAGVSISIGSACPILTEGTRHPGCGLLAPPSETLASVGSRSGSGVAVDLSHMAGSPLQRERRRQDLPPPTMS